MLAIPQPGTGSHALGALRGHPQLVLTLAGPPGRERMMRIRQTTPTAGSHHLLLQDLSPSGSPEKKSHLRSDTAPRTTTDGLFDEPNLTQVNGDCIVSWVTLPNLTTLSPPGLSSHLSSSTDGSQNPDKINYTATPPSSTLSDFSPAASDFQWPQRVTPVLTAPTSFAILACESPQVAASSKRRSDEPEVARFTKQRRSSPGRDTVRSNNLSDSIDPGPNSEDVVSDDESDSDDDDNTFINSSSTAEPAPFPTTRQPNFPCPFSLHHPQGQGHRCNHRNIKSTRSVEKHLFFHHRRPPFCPICRTIFETYAARDAHLITRTCKKTESLPVVEGLTETQVRDLSLCLDSKLSAAEQYRAMWEIVHPGVELSVELAES